MKPRTNQTYWDATPAAYRRRGRPRVEAEWPFRVLHVNTDSRYVLVHATDTISPTLSSDYFSLSWLDDGKAVSYQLPYGAWIRLFREHSLIVDDLVELRPPEHASTTYSVPEDWARRWPAEHIWKLTKR